MNLIRFLILLSAFIALNTYLFIRGWQGLPDRKLYHVIYTAIFLCASLSIFIAIFAGGKLPLWLAFVFEQVGGYWVILFVYIVAAALLGDLLRTGHHFFHIFPSWVTTHYPLARQIYFIAVLVTLGILSCIGFYRFSHTRVVELNFTFGSDTTRSSELTIVAASDLHLGNVIRKDRLTKWVELINSQKPDIIILAGDIFDHSYKAVESQQMDKEMADLHAPYGVYAIAGNHDYYTGIDRALDYLRHTGISVLRDSTVIIENRIVLIGRDDLTNRNRKTLTTLLTGVDPGLPKFVLDHQPHSLDESVENHVDLHLSGHTHNGQIFPFNRIVSRIYPLGYGYRKTGKTNFYVSSGIGLWGAPIRLGTQSEIVKIHVIFSGKKSDPI
jgi:hypothetical protein